MSGKMYQVTAKNPKLKTMLYGEPGSGKTTLAATCQDHPDMANVVFLNIEGGLLSIAHRGDINAIKIKKTEQLEGELQAIRRREAQYKGVNTVVIDSITEAQTINLEEIVDAAMASSRVSRSGKERNRNDIWQEDYGESTTALKRIIRGFKDLPINVIITALAKFVYPKVSQKVDLTDIDPIAVMPSLTAKLGESTMGYMDFVWYTFYDTEDKKFKLLTRSQGPYRAKTRGPRFQEAVGAVIVNPTMPEIYDVFVRAESGESVKPMRPAKKTKTATGTATP